jgi:phage-related protein
MKRIVWIGDSLVAIRRFPPEAKREAGFQLERVQSGLQLHNALAKRRARISSSDAPVTAC